MKKTRQLLILVPFAVIGFIAFKPAGNVEIKETAIDSLVANPEYLRGNKIELPEEISEVTEGDNLGAYIDNGKIEIYFKPHTAYQIIILGDSMLLYDGMRKVGTVATDEKNGINRLIDYDNDGIGNRIIKERTDDRGLTSIVFVTPGNDTLALDYLTKHEYDSLTNK